MTFEQLVVAAICNMVPDVVPRERDAARASVTRAVKATVAADTISQFCRWCMSAEARREMAMNKLGAQWRILCLGSLTSAHGRVSSITAMGFGTWVTEADGAGGAKAMLASEQMELRKEQAEVKRLITECETDLQIGVGNALELELTLKSLRERAAAVQERLDEEDKRQREKDREAEEMRAAMVQRVLSICARADESLASAAKLVQKLSKYGPVRSDTHIDACLSRVGEAMAELDVAEDTYNQAVQAGSYYDISEGAPDGLDRCDELRGQLEEEEARMMNEDKNFRHDLSTFSKFVRLENAQQYPLSHAHNKTRVLTRYFAAVLLQAYVRRKHDRVRYCSLIRRSKLTGGRFIPVSSKQSLTFAPVNAQHDLISPTRPVANAFSKAAFMESASASLRQKTVVFSTKLGSFAQYHG